MMMMMMMMMTMMVMMMMMTTTTDLYLDSVQMFRLLVRPELDKRLGVHVVSETAHEDMDVPHNL